MPRNTRAVRPLEPETVEAMRQHLQAEGRYADAVLVSVLAYAGLRPQEAHALCWQHVAERTLMIEQRVTNGVIRRSTRGRPGERELIFPAREGGPWNQWALDHWRGRAFKAAKEAVAANEATPYTLRHSFASLLIWEGRPVTYGAAQLGHSPATTLRTYAHVFEELEDAERTSAEVAIQRARGKLVPPQYLAETGVG
jgi:integrase